MEALYSAADLAQVKAYHTPYYVLAIVQPLTWLVALWLLLRFVVPSLYGACERVAAGLERVLGGVFRLPVLRVVPHALGRLWGGADWAAALLFVWAFDFLTQLLFFPASVYFGFVHERNFGLWHATLGRFLWESFKGRAIEATLLGFLVFGVYGLARRLARWWLLLGVVCGALLFVASALDPFRNQVSFEQTRLPPGPLRTRLEDLLRRADVPFQDLKVEHTRDVSRIVQAYFAGSGPTRTIILNDALLDTLHEDEIEAVVAHEAGHVHEVRWPGRIASAVTMLLFLWASDRLLRLAAARRWAGAESRADVRTFPLVLGLFSVASLLANPVVGWFARERELAADRYAVQLTGAPDAYRRMLIDAGSLNLADPDPPKLIVWMGMGHPPLRVRVEAVERVAAGKGR